MGKAVEWKILGNIERYKKIFFQLEIMFRNIFRYMFGDPVLERLEEIDKKLEEIKNSQLSPEYRAQKAIATIQKIIHDEL